MTGVFALIVALVASSHAPVTVEQLDGDPGTWDDREVVVTGEIVGDYSPRADVVWLQLNDDPYATAPLAESGVASGTNVPLGVRVPRAVFGDGWGLPGRYDRRGPIVEVEGVYRHNSADDQGESFLDGTAVVLVDPSRPIDIAPASGIPAVAGAALLLVAGGFFWAGRRRRIPEAD